MDIDNKGQEEEPEDAEMKDSKPEPTDEATKAAYSYAEAVKHGSFNAFKALQEYCHQSNRRAALTAKVEVRTATEYEAFLDNFTRLFMKFEIFNLN